MEHINKLPDKAKLVHNLRMVNEVSSKFYQIYIEALVTKTKVYTAHGRIGHTPKYMYQGESDKVNYKSIATAKIKKGYVSIDLGWDPGHGLGIKTVVKSKVKKAKGLKGQPGKLVSAEFIEKVIPVKPPEPVFNRLSLISD